MISFVYLKWLKGRREREAKFLKVTSSNSKPAPSFIRGRVSTIVVAKPLSVQPEHFALPPS